jgi:hypothetical protein
MIQLAKELISLFQYNNNHSRSPYTWLETIIGIGHKTESANGSIGYYTGGSGFMLKAQNTNTAPYYSEDPFIDNEFAITDTHGVAAFIAITGTVQYSLSRSDAFVRVIYPLMLTLITDIKNVEQQANALAFLLSSNTLTTNVSVNFDKVQNLEETAKRGRKTRNTSKGVANISFTAQIMQGADCTIITNC